MPTRYPEEEDGSEFLHSWTAGEEKSNAGGKPAQDIIQIYKVRHCPF